MSSPAEPRPAYLPQLTGLRFVAALGVMICHFSGLLVPVQPQAMASFNSGLFNAVSLFFVLSGFILSHTYGSALTNKTVSLAKYFFARFARIYPVFLFALLIDIPVFYVNNHPEFVSTTKFHLIQKVFLLQTWIPGPIEVSLRWNAPSWSLSTEAFFYLAFPFLISQIYRLKPKSSLLLLFGALLASTAISFFVEGRLIPLYPNTTDIGQTIQSFFGTNPLIRVLEFMAGIALYNVYRHYENQLRAWPIWAWNCVLAGATVVYALVNIYAPTLVIGQGICTAYFSFIILGLTLKRFSINTLLESPKAVLLGESSYSLYLIHFPIFHTAMAITRKLPSLTHFKENHSTIYGLFLFAISIVASVLCYQIIESPGRKLLMARFANWQRA